MLSRVFLNRGAAINADFSAFVCPDQQVRIEVKCRSGQEPSLTPEIFRKRMYCIEGSTCDIVGTFSASPAVIRLPHSDSAPGELCPLRPPFVTPLLIKQIITVTYCLSLH